MLNVSRACTTSSEYQDEPVARETGQIGTVIIKENNHKRKQYIVRVPIFLAGKLGVYALVGNIDQGSMFTSCGRITLIVRAW